MIAFGVSLEKNIQIFLCNSITTHTTLATAYQYKPDAYLTGSLSDIVLYLSDASSRVVSQPVTFRLLIKNIRFAHLDAGISMAYSFTV
jgi:hypothetical protein